MDELPFVIAIVLVLIAIFVFGNFVGEVGMKATCEKGAPIISHEKVYRCVEAK